MLNITGTGFGRLSVSMRALLFCTLLTTSTLLHAASAPVLSGTPPTTVAAGSKYYYKPVATDADGDRLVFSIANKPSWGTFSTSTGILTGSPTTAQVGLYSNITITVTDGTYKRWRAFSVQVTGSSTSNTAPRISGTPATSTRVGTAYSFQPSASDPNGDKLTFSISNKPSWATFNTGTGRLAGTPATSNIGTTSNIIIRVTDGKTSASLPSFALTVNTGSTSGTTSGSASVSWVPPTLNVDGSSLTNLAGHRIRYGLNRTDLSRTITVSNIGITRYLIENLTAGTWYFAVQAYNLSGQTSALSPISSKTIN